MSTLSSGGTVITPTAHTDYASSQAVRNVEHDIPGRSYPDITFRVAETRTGTLHLVFTSEADSEAARVALATTLGKWQLNSTITSIVMTFVTRGTIERARQVTGGWAIDVGYREVPA